jgi:hypothetical protein
MPCAPRDDITISITSTSTFSMSRSRVISRTSWPLRASSSETSTAIRRSVTPPATLPNIFAFIHSSRARFVSRSNFVSTNRRRASA